jgi:tRNA 2-thiouridine synthesizing protein E
MSALNNIERNEEGYLVNPTDWSKDIALAIAEEIDVEMSDLAWKAIDFARHDYETKGEPPTLRRITKAGGVSTKDIYRIFPKGPASKIAKIAGLGKPTGCI